MKNSVVTLALVVVAASALELSAVPASADVIFSNFGPGTTYSCCAAGTTGGAGYFSGGPYAYAEGFTPSNTYLLSQLDVAVSYVDGTPNGATISLWTESSGVLGSQLGSWDVTNLPVYGASNDTPVTVSGISGITLIAGQTYFVEVTAPDDTYDAWNTNSIGQLGPELFNDIALGPAVQEAFDVQGTAVPEPITVSLFGAGLAGAVAMRRRKMKSA